MLRTAICDDDHIICNQLQRIIKIYIEDTQGEIGVDIYHSALALSEQLKKGACYDLIFLDIEMEGHTGIEFGHWIRDVVKDERTKIVFISYEKSYAMELFRIRPIDFLTKPLRPEDVIRNIDFCIEMLEEKDILFLYQMDSEDVSIPAHEIVYFESANRIVHMHTVTGEQRFYEKLEEVKVNKRVEQRMFWRIHKSYLINTQHVRKFEYANVIMDDGTSLPISQSYRSDIRKKQKALMGNGKP